MTTTGTRAIDWHRLQHICFLLYSFYALARAATADTVLLGLEAMVVHYRMALALETASLIRLLEVPWWVIGTGAVPFLIFAIPFILIFGKTLLALQVAAAAWNLLGLWLILTSLNDDRERFWALALIAFGVPAVTELSLIVSGTYTQIILPLGLLIYLQQHFLEDAGSLNSRQAALYAAGLVVIAVFMPVLFPPLLVVSIVTLLGVGHSNIRRLWLPIVFGGAATSLLFVPFLMLQKYQNSVALDFGHFSGQFGRFLTIGLEQFLKIRGVPGSGYPITITLLATVMAGLLMLRRDDSIRHRSLLFASLFLLLWYPLNTHFDMNADEPDVAIYRQLTSAWPLWGLFLATCVGWIERQFKKNFLVTAYQAVLAASVFGGMIASFGAINWGAVGVTGRIKLNNHAGKVIHEVLPPFSAPGHMNYIERAPSHLRETLLLISPFRAIAGARRSDLMKVLEELKQLPVAEREPYWVGFGLAVCEESLRNAPAVRRRLGEIRSSLTVQESRWVGKGCDYGDRWRRGDLYFRNFSWPLEPNLIEANALRLWGDLIRYRSHDRSNIAEQVES